MTSDQTTVGILRLLRVEGPGQALDVAELRRPSAFELMGTWTELVPRRAMPSVLTEENAGPSPITAKRGDWLVLFSFLEGPSEVLYDWTILDQAGADRFVLRDVGTTLAALEEEAVRTARRVQFPVGTSH